MRRYGAHDWRTEPTNLLVTSPTGAGKTYLVCAIGIAACHSEHEVLYTRMDELARKLVIARADGIAHQDFLTKLSEMDLLIIRTPDMVQELMCGRRQGHMPQLTSRRVEIGASFSACQRLLTAPYMVMPVGGTIPNISEKALSIIERFSCNS
jgi:hypothetical protein